MHQEAILSFAHSCENVHRPIMRASCLGTLVLVLRGSSDSNVASGTHNVRLSGNDNGLVNLQRRSQISTAGYQMDDEGRQDRDSDSASPALGKPTTPYGEHVVERAVHSVRQHFSHQSSRRIEVVPWDHVPIFFPYFHTHVTIEHSGRGSSKFVSSLVTVFQFGGTREEYATCAPSLLIYLDAFRFWCPRLFVFAFCFKSRPSPLPTSYAPPCVRVRASVYALTCLLIKNSDTMYVFGSQFRFHKTILTLTFPHHCD